MKSSRIARRVERQRWGCVAARARTRNLLRLPLLCLGLGLGLGLGLSVSGCSGLGAVNLVTPDANLVAEGVAYTRHDDLRLDVYTPREDADSQRELKPVVVFLYGGGWQAGSRQQYKFVASGLTRMGFLVVVADMRKYPHVTFPAFVSDAAAAVEWTQKNIAEFGGSPQRIFLLGHSSGAHVAALLNYDERYLAQSGAPSPICGLIGLAGPYDFLPLVSPTLKNVFPPELRADSQPVNFVDGTEPPALLIHGLQDQTVKPRHSAALEQRVRAAGGSAELRIYDDEQHVTLVLALSSTLDFLAPVLADVSEFINAHTCAPESDTH